MKNLFENITSKKVLVILIILAVLAAAFFMGSPSGKNKQTAENGPSETSELAQVVSAGEAAETEPISEITSETEDATEDSREETSQQDTLSSDGQTDSSEDAASAVDSTENGKKASTAAAGSKAESTSADSKTESTAAGSKAESGSAGSSQAGSSSGTASAADSKEATASSQEEKSYTCTLSISCKTVLDHWDSLSESKQSIVPSGGVILGTVTCSFSEGETVYDVLKRECRNRGISMEGSSSYVEGIGNLYEFDCGSGSGWMYSVNGSFSNVGAGSYRLSDGDSIKWVYTCDLGNDL